MTVQPAVYRPTRSWRQQLLDALWCAWVNVPHWIEESKDDDRFYERIDAWRKKHAA